MPSTASARHTMQRSPQQGVRYATQQHRDIVKEHAALGSTILKHHSTVRGPCLWGMAGAAGHGLLEILLELQRLPVDEFLVRVTENPPAATRD